MDDQTQIIEKPEEPQKPAESHLLNMSVRAWIALIVVCTVCYMSVRTIDVKEPLYTLAGLIVGFFFGQVSKPKSQQQ